MATPLLIDTDMGVDDALAVCLALTSDRLDVQAIVAVGGSVEVDQVLKNVAGLFDALGVQKRPALGRGLDPPGEGGDQRTLYGQDGFGGCGLSSDAAPPAVDFLAQYRAAIEAAQGELVVVTTGPLSNVAAVLEADPALARGIHHVCVSGGAVWTQGDANEAAEFNFYRDPRAAAAVLGSGLSVTVAPLDVTRLVCMDESHVARLAASGYRTGEVLAALLRHPLESDAEPGAGKVRVHDAVTVGSILWPKLFMGTRMRLDVATQGDDAGRCRPSLGGDAAAQVNLLTAVNAVDFLEGLLESLCHEAFVV